MIKSINSSLVKEYKKWYIDWTFWLLFLVLNMSGNLGFGIIFNDKFFVISTFVITSLYLIKNRGYTYQFAIFLLAFTIITLFPGIYESGKFAFSSTIHITMKVAIGVNTILILKKSFIPYYIGTITAFAIISLICFTLNSIGYVVPYIPVIETSMDEGYIFRVSSVFYTQLFNPLAGELTLRNCGPFWEPGAYQGFLNLALTILILTYPDRNKWFYIVAGILITTIITTYSTGGYIVLFANIALLLSFEKKLDPVFKALILALCLFFAYNIYYTTDFLHEKVDGDTGRLGFSLNDFGNGLYFLFGYGYSSASFTESTLNTASGLINLIKYSGFCGFILYNITLFAIKPNPKRFIWGIIICLILMNEPFLTAGSFWWSVPFIWQYMESINPQLIER